jgi:hypothetical protein
LDSPKASRLFLYLIGLVLVGICVLFPTVHYWEYFQAKRAFAADAERGKPALAQVEKLHDHGRSVLPADIEHSYDEAFPTSDQYDRSWASAGFYGTSQAPTLWFTLWSAGTSLSTSDDPGPEVLKTLRQWAGLFHEDRDGIIVVPHPGLDKAIVVTAWQRRLRLSQFDPRAVAVFIDAFRGRGPERQIR